VGLILRATFILALSFFVACGHHRSRDGERVHYVVQGDTLSAIAKRYGADLDGIMQKNRLATAHHLSIGQKLVIPRPDEIFVAPPPKETIVPKIPIPKNKAPSKSDKPVWSNKKGSAKYIWPVDGVVTALYGPREGIKQDGITIAARTNTIIWACADGKVLYAGEQSGYGMIVILRHDEDLVSIYAHNDSHLVKEGQVVEQGQPIARVGQSGGATAPGVHFELRQGQKALNPLRHLP
jgi:lipoprotein NlpD